MADNSLHDDVKTYIVQALACFDTPSDVAKAVKEEFGIEITRQHAQGYDPTKAAGKDLSQRWRDLFAAEREAHKTDLDRIAIAHRATRLRRIEKLYALHAGRGNAVGAAQLLVQAAKEVGDVYTNRQKIDASHTHRSHEDALADLERGNG